MMYGFILLTILMSCVWGYLEYQDRKRAKELKHLIQQARERALQRVEERDALRSRQYKAEMAHRRVMTQHISQRKENAVGRSYPHEWSFKASGK